MRSAVPGAAPWPATIRGTRRHSNGPRRRRHPATTSPASPSCDSANPLWDDRDTLPVATGLRVDRRELIVSSLVEARPEARESSPRPLHLAAADSAGHQRDAGLVDLLAMGGGLGSDTGGGRADRLVLAEGHAGGRSREDSVSSRTSADLPLHGMGDGEPDLVGYAGFHAAGGHRVRAGASRSTFIWRAWPTAWPIGAPPPDLLPGTLVTVVLLISAVPNLLISRWAAQQQMAKVRLGLVVMTMFGVAAADPAHLRVPRAAHLLGQQRLWLDRLDDAGAAHDACADGPGGYGRAARR